MMKNLFSILEKIANYIWQKPLYQHILFALATYMAISFMGYHFGTFDQASHIPYLKKTVDPTLYPNDHFFDLRNTHYSYFWLFFIPFYRLGILEITMFVVYIIAVYLTFWALWRLTKTIFNNPLTNFLAIFVFILPHIGFGAFPIFEFSLLNRTFVLPFLILAIDFYLKRKFIFAFILLGVMYNLHVISANFVLAMFALDFVLRFKKTGLKNIVFSLFLFILTALPVLVWKFSGPLTRGDFAVNWSWFKVIDQSILYHLFHLVSTYPHILLLTLSGLSMIAIYFISRKYKHNQVIDHFVYAILIILLVEFITATWLPVTIIIESQIIRAGVFLIIFSYLFFTNYLVSLYNNGKVKEEQGTFILASLLLSVTPIILVIALFAQKFFKQKLALRIMLAVVVISFIGIGFVAHKFNLWQPKINIYAKKNTNYDVQMWAKKKTSKDTVFITPPHTWWFYNNEWRVISERSTVVSMSELLEAAFSPEYLDYWRPRFEDVAPGAIKQFKGNYFKNVEITKHAYYSLNKDDFLRLGIKYKAKYVVVEKPYHYDLPVVYENAGYVVYQLF